MLSDHYHCIYTRLKYQMGFLPYIPNLPNLLELFEQKKQRDYDRAMQPALERQRIARLILSLETLSLEDRQNAIKYGFIMPNDSINFELIEPYRKVKDNV